MTNDDLDGVWKALSDGTRRSILDLLRQGPRTTTQIVEEFPHLSRFGVMKHIEVLREAGLVRWSFRDSAQPDPVITRGFPCATRSSRNAERVEQRSGEPAWGRLLSVRRALWSLAVGVLAGAATALDAATVGCARR